MVREFESSRGKTAGSGQIAAGSRPDSTDGEDEVGPEPLSIDLAAGSGSFRKTLWKVYLSRKGLALARCIA